MRAQIDVLAEVFTEWLRIHELDYDYRIYTATEWTEREGSQSYFRGAELVIVFENSLVRFLEDGSLGIHDELQELSEGFGYYFERGETWNIGFYPLEKWPPLPASNARYPELLTDERWKRKRQRILARSENRCENCRSTQQLEIHHCYYRYGRMPWQYPDAALLAVCRECHQARATVELEWRGFMPRLKIDEIQTVKAMLDHCLYWYDRKELFSFLEAMGTHKDGEVSNILAALLKTKCHPEERNAA